MESCARAHALESELATVNTVLADARAMSDETHRLRSEIDDAKTAAAEEKARLESRNRRAKTAAGGGEGPPRIRTRRRERRARRGLRERGGCPRI